MRPSVFICLCAAALFGACYAPPQRVDPFAQLTRSDLASRRLSVVLVNTENARNARKYLLGTRYASAMTDAIFENFVAVFRRNFKSVTTADDVEEAKASGADVVALLDVYASVFQGFMNAGNHLELGAILLAADGTPIDHIKAADDASGLKYASATGPMEELATNTPLMFERALRTSGKLQSFSPSRSAAAFAAAPVPATAALHSDVDKPGYAMPENANDFAVVIGVEKYESLPAAEFAGRDAEAVRAHLTALGYPTRNIYFLSGPQATRAKFAQSLNTWLPNRVDANSTVFFYYSGHGAPDPKTGQAYLVPVDGDAEDLDSTAYPIKQLYAKLGDLKARHVVVALDSCFSGAGGRSVIAKGTRPLVGSIDLGGVPDNVIALTASNKSEVSGTLEDQGHGAFTYYMLKGLEGAAKNGSGHVTVQSLYGYLAPKVQDAARLHNRDQTPQLLPAASSAEVSRIQLR